MVGSDANYVAQKITTPRLVCYNCKMREIHVVNTLGREKKLFTPIEKGKVSFYHCGPTVYWTQQIGNMFAMSQADFIRRSFEYLGYRVSFVRNYTDVGHLSGDNHGDADTGEDRMEKAARRENRSPREIADHYIQEFDKHLDLLNITPPTHRPRATEYIQSMIDLTGDLLDKGVAYQTPLAIYFDTSKKADYFKLSGQDPTGLASGSGHGSVTDGNKKSPHDFALWFFKAGVHRQALQTWPNPFSEVQGFPGWHIECSAMIRELLGETIDVHMGGVEHIPIHHTNEIAQSECAHNAPLANFWLHNEHLLIDGKKMSKSAGTAVTLEDIMDKKYHPLDLRYFFLQAHYRTRQNFTWDGIEAAHTARERLHQRVANIYERGTIITQYQEKFASVLADDFNIPAALAVVYEVLKAPVDEGDKKATILDFDRVLGIGLEQAPKQDSSPISLEAQALADRRHQARAEKDWATADSLRQEIADLGYEVIDTDGGQTLHRI